MSPVIIPQRSYTKTFSDEELGGMLINKVPAKLRAGLLKALGAVTRKLNLTGKVAPKLSFPEVQITSSDRRVGESGLEGVRWTDGKGEEQVRIFQTSEKPKQKSRAKKPSSGVFARKEFPKSTEIIPVGKGNILHGAEEI